MIEELDEPREVEDLRQRIRETVEQIREMTDAEKREMGVNY